MQNAMNASNYINIRILKKDITCEFIELMENDNSIIYEYKYY